MARKRVTLKRRASNRARATGVQLGDEQARGMILGGAMSVFAKAGVRDVSVDDLLNAARLSRRTFYRLYTSKEDVLVALYRIGTDWLLDSCRFGMMRETDPMQQIQACIDAHLRTARDSGRLVFVLGGEAQRHESALHARRMETHAELVQLIMTSTTATKLHIDPLLVRGLVLALEGVV